MKILISALAFITFMPTAFSGQLEVLRVLFFSADHQHGAEQFHWRASQIPERTTPILLAYKGTAFAIYAGYATGISNKIKKFNTGKDYLEQAVMEDPLNPEIRFLRFSIQAESPFFLGYCGDIKHDALSIVQAVETHALDCSTEHWQKALDYMCACGELNDEQIDTIKKYCGK